MRGAYVQEHDLGDEESLIEHVRPLLMDALDASDQTADDH